MTAMTPAVAVHLLQKLEEQRRVEWFTLDPFAGEERGRERERERMSRTHDDVATKFRRQEMDDRAVLMVM